MVKIFKKNIVSFIAGLIVFASCATVQPIIDKHADKIRKITAAATIIYQEFRRLRGAIGTVEQRCKAIIESCKNSGDKQCIPLHKCIASHSRLNEIANYVDGLLVSSLNLARLGDFDRAQGVIQQVKELIESFKAELMAAMGPVDKVTGQPKLHI